MNSLHAETLALVKEERRLVGLVIENLQKISDTKLFLEMGYSSLFRYCTQALGYSESSAFRRLEAVKVMRAVPEVKEKLNDGTLNLTNIAMAQTFFKASRATIDQKKTAMTRIEGCSKRETEKTLAEMFKIEPPRAGREKVRHFCGEEASLHIIIPQEVLQKLERIKSLRAHKNPNMSYAEVIADMCEIVLKKIDPMAKVFGSPRIDEAEVHRTDEGLSAAKAAILRSQKPKEHSRYIPAKIKNDVWHRDEGKCTFIDTTTGRRCSSPHLLQIDHDMPLFLGGATSLKNLRLLCHAHHRLRNREFEEGFEQ